MTGAFDEQRVYLTGGTGFLGTAVRRALAARGVTEVLAPSSAEVDLLWQYRY